MTGPLKNQREAEEELGNRILAEQKARQDQEAKDRLAAERRTKEAEEWEAEVDASEVHPKWSRHEDWHPGETTEKIEQAARRVASGSIRFRPGAIQEILAGAVPAATSAEIGRVFQERARQDTIWGKQRLTWPEWGSIFAEEAGELHQEINQAHFRPRPASMRRRAIDVKRMREEAIQAAAVLVAMAEHLTEELERIEDEKRRAHQELAAMGYGEEGE